MRKITVLACLTYVVREDGFDFCQRCASCLRRMFACAHDASTRQSKAKLFLPYTRLSRKQLRSNCVYIHV